MCTLMEFDFIVFFICRISTVQVEWKHNFISMRWCCKICRFSSSNQHALITHYKLRHCHQTTKQKMRTAELLGLPWYMQETPKTFMKICEPSDREEDVIQGLVIEILMVVEYVMEPLSAFYNDVPLVIEEEVVRVFHAGTPFITMRR
ncbi:hypothetical protein HF521_011766 [Silurus meridionalis]|uniref:Uncharacterized protein n=1 Tax=Silurus meridionalis TaxID=175797 RepID=A0A8T0AFJ4_SILME|nr:hypothetical protein HF521_011766 [Silurus meridionalis]